MHGYGLSERNYSDKGRICTSHKMHGYGLSECNYSDKECKQTYCLRIYTDEFYNDCEQLVFYRKQSCKNAFIKKDKFSYIELASNQTCPYWLEHQMYDWNNEK